MIYDFRILFTMLLLLQVSPTLNSFIFIWPLERLRESIVFLKAQLTCSSIFCLKKNNRKKRQTNFIMFIRQTVIINKKMKYKYISG